MALANVISSVQAKIAAIAGANVHEYTRVLNKESDFKLAFFDDVLGRIHGWTITTEDCDSVDLTVGGQKDVHKIIMRGYMGVDDADNTEKLLRDESEAVRVALRADRRLKDGAGNPTVFWCQPVKRRLFGHVHFGAQQVLCNYVELAMQVEEYPL
jgi:hypothetical protein